MNVKSRELTVYNTCTLHIHLYGNNPFPSYRYHDGEDANGPFPASDMKEWYVKGLLFI